MYQAVFVDDEPLVLEDLKQAIDWEGYNFEIAYTTTNPIDALDYIQNHKINLLITDVSMPSMNGLELIKAVKQIDPLLSILILSGHNQFDFVKTALRYGCKDYILKPLVPNELADSIKQVVKNIDERDQVSTTYKNAMLSFRNNFTENWVNNNLSPTDLITKANLLGINLHTNNFSVIIFTSTNHNSENMLTFFDLFLEKLPGKFLSHFYFETPTRLTCILSSLNSSTYTIEALIKSVLLEANTNNLSIFAALGKTVFNYNEVHTSYQQAKLLLLIPYTYPIDFTNSFYEKISVSLDVPVTLLELISLKDYTSCLRALHQLFSFRDVQAHPKEYSLFITSHLLLQLGSDIHNSFSNFPTLKSFAENFSSLSTVEGHLNFTLSFADLCLNSMKSIEESMYPCVNTVIKIIHEFNDKDISLKTLANKLNITPSYLGTLFKQQTGYYFNDYLSEARLNYACELLVSTDMKVKDIVEKVGFSSATYFNRNFKHHFNISPISYRRQKKSQKSLIG